jgi:two-component system, NtrC family, nitrogen regulation sensor histidine kinase NtrY
VIVSVLAIGGASALFILNVSSNKNLSFLSEKAHSILVETEMTLDIAGIDEFNERNRSYVTDLLLRQSNVFFTDINLYDNNGELISSSRPRVFEEGLAGTLMDPVAFFTMRNHQLNQFVHTESIGKLEYLSAYILLRNHYQELLGFINLPYFAKQSDLRDEMSYFLVAFINIYLLLLVIAIVVALFISNFVTQPLQLIRESLSKVQLGRINQKINWTRQDEIGGLVMEYNRMIDELAESADLLARSERETAWREMAKQVAHEIKNPLTPMRLNIQYLEKAWKEKTPDWEERLARFTKTMVEQIDNLALIAGAFSDFAKMPEGHNHVLDFRQFLPEALDLFNDTDRASINITMPHADQPLLVRADKSQLIRVMNNLVNNAIQAYPKHAEAQVDILCQREGGDIYVEVKDYGCGIPETLKSNIFSPNFTTKTRRDGTWPVDGQVDHRKPGRKSGLLLRRRTRVNLFFQAAPGRITSGFGIFLHDKCRKIPKIYYFCGSEKSHTSLKNKPVAQKLGNSLFDRACQ